MNEFLLKLFWDQAMGPLTGADDKITPHRFRLALKVFLERVKMAAEDEYKYGD